VSFSRRNTTDDSEGNNQSGSGSWIGPVKRMFYQQFNLGLMSVSALFKTAVMQGDTALLKAGWISSIIPVKHVHNQACVGPTNDSGVKETVPAHRSANRASKGWTLAAKGLGDT
jgi:hypothetical protein